MSSTLWTPGATTPQGRTWDMQRRDPFSLVMLAPLRATLMPAGWPAIDTLSPDQIGDLVFDFMRRQPLPPGELIPDAEKDRVAVMYGRASWNDVFSTPGLASALASAYLAVSLQTPLPDDFEGVLPESIAHDWPGSGDNLERRIYGWDFKVKGWDASGYIPHLVATKVMQIQKWSTSDQAWKVYNQQGTDLVFSYAPKAWSAGFSVQEWLDEHMNEIFTAWQIIFYAATAIIGSPAIAASVAAVQQAERGLAYACAGGNLDAIAAAVVNVGGTIGNLPGGKQMFEDLKNAGAGAISDAMAKGKQSLAVILPALSDAGGDLSSALAKVSANAGALRTTVTQEIADVRTNLIHPGLRPWFDKAIAQGTGAATRMFSASIPVPWYARGAWDVGACYGTIAGYGAQHGFSGIRTTVVDVQNKAAQASITVTPAEKIAANNLLLYVRQLEKGYGLTALETATRRAELKAAGYTDQQLKAWGY